MREKKHQDRQNKNRIAADMHNKSADTKIIHIFCTIMLGFELHTDY